MADPSKNLGQESVLSPQKASKSEEDILEGLKQRENWAYQEVIDRYAEKLYRVAYRFFPQEESAQDIVQDVLKKIVEKIHTFKGESSLYTWLYRVTVNECLMKLRSSRSKKTVPWDDILPKFENGALLNHDSYKDWNNLPDEQVMVKEASEFIRQCVEELPEDYRAAYIVKDLEQRSENEVCEMLGLTKAVMKVRVHRARLYLRKRLEERYVTHS